MTAQMTSAMPAGMSSGMPSMPLGRSPLALGTVLAVHVALAWALLSSDTVERVLRQAQPLMISIVDATSPPAPPAHALPAPALPSPPPLHPPPPMQIALPPPVVIAEVQPRIEAQAVVAPSPVPAPTPAPAPAPAPNPAPAAAPAEPAPAITAVPAPAPSGPRRLPDSALGFVAPPQVVYPRASRRLRETGRVLVRVLIDTQGLPARLQVEKSSGHPLLDDAALDALRRARFKPWIENGQPQPGWALIPIDFQLDT